MITQALLEKWKRWATDNGRLSLPRDEMLAIIAEFEEAREAALLSYLIVLTCCPVHEFWIRTCKDKDDAGFEDRQCANN